MFYGMSTIIGHLMPNHIYIYIYISQHILWITFLNEPELLFFFFFFFFFLQLNGFQVLLYKSQFNISNLFALLVWLIWPVGKTLSGATTPGQWTWEQWQWRGTLYIPNIQSWSLAIRWLNVIYRTLIKVWCYPYAEMKLVYSTAPGDCAKYL